ncbi:MAG: capsular polysaccharide export protein, LipB/KpsS family, partial [Planctomycetota bacterium]
QLTLLTNKLSIAALARAARLPAYLVRAADVARGLPPTEEEVGRCREVAAGELKPGSARRLFQGVMGAVQRAHDAHKFAAILVWNGGDAEGHALRRFAAAHNVKSLFLEIANLPGKLFADPEGVNAASSLYRNPSVLDQSPPDLTVFRSWRDRYIEAKLRRHVVPQARSAGRLNWLSPLDSWGYGALGIPHGVERSLVAKARRKWSKRHRPPAPTGTPAGPYVLFPLQVSNDTQILLNSDVTLPDAIRQAGQTASRLDCSLLVKPHPAEPNVAFVDQIMRLRESVGFEVVEGNTFALIQGAQRVVTINSTVGLEAQILSVPADFLGHTHLRHLHSEQRLASYVTDFLLDIDYFAKDPIPRERALQILERLA